MKTYLLLTIIIASLLLAACGTAPTATPSEPTQDAATAPAVEAQTGSASNLPPAEIANDEGGVQFVTGEYDYKSSYVVRHFTEPVALLLNISRTVGGNYTESVPVSGQILGFLTRPLAPAPTAYQVNVPVRPSDASVDVDNDGQQDAGVQIYGARMSSNIAGDSYLVQTEQAGFDSFLTDPQTNVIREGTLLIYAPDDQQGFPSGAGEDGDFFTADDPVVGLPAGYTLATLSLDGTVTFDRSREARMNILEAASYQSPDFSDQGILESYNSLIDVLKQRYAYTELRGLDWEEIRQKYLPQVESADQAGDTASYYNALREMALSIRDAHVFISTADQSLNLAFIANFNRSFSGSLGARIAELSDGRFIVTFLAPDSPASKAGWKIGTEILSVNGVPIGEHVASLPLLYSVGNPEIIRLKQTELALAFPAGTATTVEYQNPEETRQRSTTLTAVEGLNMEVPKPSFEVESISYKQLENGAYYIQWDAFTDELYKIAVWEKVLQDVPGGTGLIIDMRRNSGGSALLMYTMASYLFAEEAPAKLHWTDLYTYDDKAGDVVQEFATDYTLYSPKPALTYRGPVVVLVGEGSASAAEYFPQFLQSQGRANVVGEHGTEGAGGSVETAAMPGGITIWFTKGRTYFAGTNELNLEAKGVTLDVRVPITLENELAKQEGRDVVLEAGVAALNQEAARMAIEQLTGTTWQLTKYQTTETGTGKEEKVQIDDPSVYAITFGDGGQMTIRADCNQATAEYTIGAGSILTVKVGPTTLAACAEGSLSEKFLAALANDFQLQTDGEQLVLLYESESYDVIALQFLLEK